MKKYVAKAVKNSVMDCIYSGVLDTGHIADTIGYSKIYVCKALCELYEDYGITGNSQYPRLVWKILKGQEFAK